MHARLSAGWREWDLQVLDLIRELEREWTGPDYSLVAKNCVHFSARLCAKLGAAPVPPWVNRYRLPAVP
jgi:hypothetical protein